MLRSRCCCRRSAFCWQMLAMILRILMVSGGVDSLLSSTWSAVFRYSRLVIIRRCCPRVVPGPGSVRVLGAPDPAAVQTTPGVWCPCADRDTDRPTAPDAPHAVLDTARNNRCRWLLPFFSTPRLFVARIIGLYFFATHVRCFQPS